MSTASFRKSIFFISTLSYAIFKKLLNSVKVPTQLLDLNRLRVIRIQNANLTIYPEEPHKAPSILPCPLVPEPLGCQIHLVLNLLA